MVHLPLSIPTPNPAFDTSDLIVFYSSLVSKKTLKSERAKNNEFLGNHANFNVSSDLTRT